MYLRVELRSEVLSLGQEAVEGVDIGLG